MTASEDIVSALRLLPQALQALKDQMGLTEYLGGKISCSGATSFADNDGEFRGDMERFYGRADRRERAVYQGRDRVKVQLCE